MRQPTVARHVTPQLIAPLRMRRGRPIAVAICLGALALLFHPDPLTAHPPATPPTIPWVPIVWEPVHPEQDWISGALPRVDWKSNRSWVALMAGEPMTLRIPPFEMCQMVAKHRQEVAQPPEVWLSSDGHMHRKVKPVPTPDGCGWLINPVQDAPVWMTLVGRCRGAAEEWQLALSHAIDRPAPPAIYRPLGCQELSVQWCDRTRVGDVERYTYLPAAQELDLSGCGFPLLRLRIRIIYPVQESARRQRIPLTILRDGVPWQTLQVLAIPDTNVYVRCQDRALVVSDLEEAWLALPQDHARYTLMTPLDLLLRCEQAGSEGYAWPLGGQEGRLSTWLSRQEGDDFPPQGVGPRFETETEISSFLINPLGVPWRSEHFQVFANDQQRCDTGVTATYLARQWVALATHQPRRQRWLQHLSHRRTRSLTLTPQQTTQPQKHYPAYFVPHTSSSPIASSTTDASRWPNLVASQHVADLVRKQLGQTLFVETSERELTYALPRSPVNIPLQVVVPLECWRETSSLTLHFDGDASCVVVRGGACVAAPCRRQTLTEAALQGIDWIHGMGGNSTVGRATLGGPVWATTGEHGLCLAACMVEVEVPAGAQQLVVRTDSAQLPPLALRARISMDELPTESEYLAALPWCRTGGSLWDQWVASESQPSVTDMQAGLLGPWTSLRRRVRSHLPPLALQQALDRRQTTPPQELTQEIRSLAAEGEQYLLDQYLIAHLMDPQPETRTTARDELWQRWSGLGREEELVELAAQLAWLDPGPESRAQLAHALANTGRYLEALVLAHDMQASDRPWRLIVRCAFQTGWNVLFQQSLEQLPSAERKLWEGLKWAEQGQPELADACWEQASETGASCLTQARTARSILADVQAPEFTRRMRGIERWQQWQQVTLGPTVWRDWPALQTTHQSQLVHSRSSGHWDVWCQSTPDQPVTYRVEGPARVRLLCRPVVPAKLHETSDDWLDVVREGTSWLRPIPASQVNPNLQLSTSELQCGRSTVAELALGPGTHQLSVRLQKQTGLFTLQRAVPEWRSPHLPLLTPEIVSHLQRTALSRPASSDLAASDPRPSFVKPCHLLMSGSAELPRPLIPRSGEWDSWADLHDLVHVVSCPGVLPPVGSVPAAPTLAWNDPTYQGMANRLVDLPADEPADRAAWAHLAYASAQQHAAPGYFDLKQRFDRQTEWSLVGDVVSSAGLVRQAMTGWQPEHPALRTRAHLIDPPPTGGKVLTSDSKITIQSNRRQASRLVLTINRLHIPYVESRPIDLCWSVNQGPTSRVSLPVSDATPSENVHQEIDVPAGESETAIWMEAAGPNQFVELHSTFADDRASRITDQTYDRFYHLATESDPVVLLTPIDSCFRLDFYDESTRTHTEYRLARAGHELIIGPPAGRTQALIRIFESVPRWQPMRKLPLSSIAQEAPRDSWWSPGLVPWEPNQAPLTTLWPGSQQHPGTLSTALAWVQRRPVEEGQGLRLQDKFWELSPTLRYWESEEQRYHRVDLIGRVRPDASDSCGLSYAWDYVPDELPYRFAAELDGFVQPDVVQAGTLDTETAWSARGWASVERRFSLHEHLSHTPIASLTGRWLSHRSDDLPLLGVDQDIFTPYKAQHLAALTLGDEWVRQAWNDRALWLRYWVTTNEDCNPLAPDYGAVRAGLRQIWGPLDWDVSYRWAHFFADHDRNNSFQQHLLYVDSNWNAWNSPAYRWELGFSLRQDLLESGTTVQLMLSSTRHGRRLFRDFAPDGVRFRQMRNWQTSLAQ